MALLGKTELEKNNIKKPLVLENKAKGGNEYIQKISNLQFPFSAELIIKGTGLFFFFLGLP